MNKPENHINHPGRGCLSPDELIAYSKGNLSPDEMYGIEMHTIDCPLCADAVDGFEDPGAEKALSALDELFAKSNLKKKTIFFTNKTVFIGVAALLAIVLGSVYLFQFVTDTSRSRMMSDNAAVTEDKKEENSRMHAENILQTEPQRSDAETPKKETESTVKIIQDKPRDVPVLELKEIEMDNIAEGPVENYSDVKTIVQETRKESLNKKNDAIPNTGQAPTTATTTREEKTVLNDDVRSIERDASNAVSLSEVPVAAKKYSVDGQISTSKDSPIKITTHKNKICTLSIQNGVAIATSNNGTRVTVFVQGKNPVIKREYLSLVGNVVSYLESTYDANNSKIISKQIIAKNLSKNMNAATLTLLIDASDIYAALKDDKKLNVYSTTDVHSDLGSFIKTLDGGCDIHFSTILSSYSIVKYSGGRALVKFGLGGTCSEKTNQYKEFLVWIRVDNSRISNLEEAAANNNLDR